MAAIDSIKIDGKSNAFFDELKLNHPTVRKKIRKIADGKRGFIGDSLQQLFRVFALCSVNEQNRAAGFILRS